MYLFPFVDSIVAFLLHFTLVPLGIVRVLIFLGLHERSRNTAYEYKGGHEDSGAIHPKDSRKMISYAFEKRAEL